MSSKFTMTMQNPKNRDYIVKRKTGWYAISVRKIDGHNIEQTTIGPMSREDAVLARDGMKAGVQNAD